MYKFSYIFDKQMNVSNHFWKHQKAAMNYYNIYQLQTPEPQEDPPMVERVRELENKNENQTS